MCLIMRNYCKTVHVIAAKRILKMRAPAVLDLRLWLDTSILFCYSYLPFTVSGVRLISTCHAEEITGTGSRSDVC